MTGATPLMNAVQGGSEAKVRFLLDRGTDVNAANGRGFTPLHRAAEMGQAGVARLLLERGARPDAEAQGKTLHLTGRAARLRRGVGFEGSPRR